MPARACMHVPSKEEEEEEEEEEEVSCMHVRGARMRWLRFQGTSAAQDGLRASEFVARPQPYF